MNLSSIKKYIALILACSVCLCSCGNKGAIDVKEEEAKPLTEYTTRQVFTLIRSQQKKVEDVYTADVFAVKMGESGNTYADTFLGIMKDYIVKLYTMTDMANERGVSLDAKEQESIQAAAEKYVEAENKAENNIGISVEEVVMLLTDISLCQHLRQQIINSNDIEISESEARIADIQRIVVASQAEAEAIVEKYNNGEDFLTMAKSDSINTEIELKCAKDDLHPAFADAVFALEDGELSEIIPQNNAYYIFRCERGYDEEATATRKAQIQTERINQILSDEYNSYAAEHQRTIDDAVWTMAVRLFSSKAHAGSIFGLTGEIY